MAKAKAKAKSNSVPAKEVNTRTESFLRRDEQVKKEIKTEENV